MREVTFDKALRYKKNDIIIQSEHLKNFVANVKQQHSLLSVRKNPNFDKLVNVAEEMAMPFDKANNVIHEFIDDITYIDVMSNARFFVVEY